CLVLGSATSAKSRQLLDREFDSEQDFVPSHSGLPQHHIYQEVGRAAQRPRRRCAFNGRAPAPGTNRRPTGTGISPSLAIIGATASWPAALQYSFDLTTIERGSFGRVLDKLETRPNRAGGNGGAGRNTRGSGYGEQRDSPSEWQNRWRQCSVGRQEV